MSEMKSCISGILKYMGTQHVTFPLFATLLECILATVLLREGSQLMLAKVRDANGQDLYILHDHSQSYY